MVRTHNAAHLRVFETIRRGMVGKYGYSNALPSHFFEPGILSSISELFDLHYALALRGLPSRSWFAFGTEEEQEDPVLKLQVSRFDRRLSQLGEREIHLMISAVFNGSTRSTLLAIGKSDVFRQVAAITQFLPIEHVTKCAPDFVKFRMILAFMNTIQETVGQDSSVRYTNLMTELQGLVAESIHDVAMIPVLIGSVLGAVPGVNDIIDEHLSEYALLQSIFVQFVQENRLLEFESIMQTVNMKVTELRAQNAWLQKETDNAHSWFGSFEIMWSNLGTLVLQSTGVCAVVAVIWGVYTKRNIRMIRPL